MVIYFNRKVAMLKTISATGACINFGDVMKQAKIAPVIVEHDGKAEAVVLSKKAYDQLIAAKEKTDLKKRLEDLHSQIRAESAVRTLPDPAEIIPRGREEGTLNLKVKNLITLLSEMPADADVVLKGYEGGVDDVLNVKLVKIKKDIHAEWYYGRHEIDEAGGVQAVFIQREERKAEEI